MGRDYILSVIRDYASERWAKPERPLSRENFQQRSYTQWAVEELIYDFNSHPDEPPLVIIELFIEKSQRYAQRRKGGMIFETAYEVGMNILDLLNAIE